MRSLLRFQSETELGCPVEFCAGLPLLAGRVDLSDMASGYCNSGFAISAVTINSQIQVLFRVSSPIDLQRGRCDRRGPPTAKAENSKPGEMAVLCLAPMEIFLTSAV